MDDNLGAREIARHAEIREPHVLYAHVTHAATETGRAASAVQNREDRERQVRLPSIEDLLVALNHPVRVPPERVLGRDHCTHTRPADHIDRDTSLRECLQEPDVSKTPRPSSAQGHAKRATAGETCDA